MWRWEIVISERNDGWKWIKVNPTIFLYISEYQDSIYYWGKKKKKLIGLEGQYQKILYGVDYFYGTFILLFVFSTMISMAH
jgi:hypothetical protein